MSFRQASVLPGFGLTFGFTTFFLSTMVLLPLAALVLAAGSMHWSDFVHVVFSARALGSYRLSFGASFLARPLGAHVNLIPLNPTPGYVVAGSTREAVASFRDEIAGHGINVTVRNTRGRDVNGACGQLAGSALATSRRLA